ncbi:MAG: urease accessory protein UreE [Beijerinckiaceae bacterium]
MLRATHFIHAAQVDADHIIDTITLDAESRYRRRIRLATDSGQSLMLDLARAVQLQDGDGLVTGPFAVVQVRAAPQELYAVSCEDTLQMRRIIWHLGNRHTPTEIGENAVYIARDHVLAGMLEGLGATVVNCVRPFRPEGGAYGGHGAAHGHHHGSNHEQ